MGRWLVLRRNIDDPSECAYYLAYGAKRTPVQELIRIVGRRWQIEDCFETAKGEVSLDEYEVRNRDGWHRHTTLSLLAHAYLAGMLWAFGTGASWRDLPEEEFGPWRTVYGRYREWHEEGLWQRIVDMVRLWR